MIREGCFLDSVAGSALYEGHFGKVYAVFEFTASWSMRDDLVFSYFERKIFILLYSTKLAEDIPLLNILNASLEIHSVLHKFYKAVKRR